MKKYILLILLFVSHQLFAAKEITNNRVYPEDQPSVEVLSVDNKYSFMKEYSSQWTSEFRNRAITNKIELGIDHAKMFFSGVDYGISGIETYEVTVDLKLKKWNSGAFVESTINGVELSITYDPERKSAYTDKSIFLIKDALWVEATITSSTNLPDFVYVDNEIEVERYYSYGLVYEPDANLIELTTTADEKLGISFPLVRGAEAYDLEWVYVENIDTDSPIPDTDLNYDFDKEATRVRIIKNSYSIPLVYNSGYLLFRYRPVFTHRTTPSVAYDLTIEGKWSTDTDAGDLVTGDVSQFKAGYSTAPFHQITNWYDENKNWGFNMGFAEKGLISSSISYVDGLGRSRQGLSSLNTEDKVMVAGAIFDAEGRSPVSVLPSPIAKQDFRFVEGLHRSEDVAGVVPNAPYDYTDFDTDDKVGNAAGNCEYEFNKMDIGLSQGAANYYSEKNPDQEGVNAFIPDAEGVPFSIVQYMPDQTGRVRTMSGGVGKGFEWKSGHELQFYYENLTDSELEELFQTDNHGDAQLYSKDIVIDQHGQWSTVYKDPSGRVIASMLTGDRPTNLEAIDDNSTLYTKNVDLTNYVTYQDEDEFVVEYELLARGGTEYTFNYQLTESEISYSCNNGTNTFCYRCFYNVELSVEEQDVCDPTIWNSVSIDGLKNATGTIVPFSSPVNVPFTSEVSAYTDGFAEACDNVASDYEFETADGFQITPVKTTKLRVIKKVKLREDALEDIALDVKQNNLCIESIETRMDNQSTAIDEQINNCSFDPCEACDRNFPDNHTTYIDGVANGSIPDMGYLDPSDAADYLAAAAIERENCHETYACPGSDAAKMDWCSRIRREIRDDFMPGGAFAYYDPTNSAYLSTDPNSIFNLFTNTIGFHYQNVTYKDSYGNVLTGTSDPASMSPIQFIQNFDPYWLESIIDYIIDNNVTSFPGYCYLDNCNDATIQTYFDYEAELLAIQTAVEAENYGTGSLGLFQNLSSTNPRLHNDPFSNTNFENYLNDIDNSKSIYEYVSEFVTGSAPTSSYTFPNSSNCQEDREWLMLRALYIKERQNQILADEFGSCSYIRDLSDFSFENDAPFDDYMTWITNFNPFDASTIDGPHNGPGGTATTDCADNCNQIATTWVTDNLPCVQSILTETQIIALTADLAGFCAHTCAGLDIYGTYTSATPYTASYGSVSSVNEILEDYIDGIGGATYPTKSCNIYNLQGIGVDNPNYSEIPLLNACGCDKIWANNTAAANASLNPNGLSNKDFFTATYGVELVDYDALNCACDVEDIDNSNSINTQAEIDDLSARSIFVNDILTCTQCVNSYELFDPVTGFEKAFLSYIDNYTGTKDESYYKAFSRYLLQNELIELDATDLELYREEYDQYATDQKVGPSNLYPQAYTMMQLLNDLITRGEFINSNYNIPWFHDYYRGNLFPYLFSTPTSTIDMGVVNVSSPYVSGNSLTITLSNTVLSGGDPGDHDPMTHDITLVKPGSVDFNDIVNIENIYADLSSISASGDQKTFELEVLVENSSTGVVTYETITGSVSDYIIYREMVQANGSYHIQWCEDRFSDVKQPDPCIDNIISRTLTDIATTYQEEVDDAVADFMTEYKASCLAVSEDFTLDYEETDYAATLYYYSIDGNLIQTVPPIGVSKGTPANHSQKTQYHYNTLNQLTETVSPDGGKSQYWYNDKGQLLLSQNAQQKVDPDAPTGYEAYSYTQYDYLGRIIEVGELYANASSGVAFGTLSYEDQLDLLNTSTFPYQTISGVSGVLDWTVDSKREVTRTQYSSSLSNVTNGNYFEDGQKQLRNRIASVVYQEEYNSDITIYDHASHFSYDIHGNVIELIQENTHLQDIDQHLKWIEYDYDLLSGNVNHVYYQKDRADQLIHQYIYDEDNRLREVYTSSDGVSWSRDADYKYYEHGPLARIEIGQHKVQGVDFAYNLQGWLKGVNAGTLSPTIDLGKDGADAHRYINGEADLHLYMANDIYGFNLDYFDDATMTDHKFIDPNKSDFVTEMTGTYASSTNNLYNGNIKGMIVSLTDDNGDPLDVHAKGFAYDQLNRLKSQRVYTAADIQSTNSTASAIYTDDYYTTYSYDNNGNLKTLLRNGYTNIQEQIWNPMDDFTYSYDVLSGHDNRLLSVADGVSNDGFTTDIENGQNSTNYTYNEIGQLVGDEQEEIDNIEWNVYGKVKKITRTATSTKPDLEFLYDAFGNRIAKITKPKQADGTLKSEAFWEKTYYTLDASGSAMGIYSFNSKEGLPYLIVEIPDNLDPLIHNIGLKEIYPTMTYYTGYSFTHQNQSEMEAYSELVNVNSNSGINYVSGLSAIDIGNNKLKVFRLDGEDFSSIPEFYYQLITPINGNYNVVWLNSYFGAEADFEFNLTEQPLLGSGRIGTDLKDVKLHEVVISGAVNSNKEYIDEIYENSRNLDYSNLFCPYGIDYATAAFYVHGDGTDDFPTLTIDGFSIQYVNSITAGLTHLELAQLYIDLIHEKTEYYAIHDPNVEGGILIYGIGLGSLTYTSVNNSKYELTSVFKQYADTDSPCYTQNDLGNKRYELFNHLGNVMQTISDRRVYVDVSNSSGSSLIGGSNSGFPVLGTQGLVSTDNWDNSSGQAQVQSLNGVQSIQLQNIGDAINNVISTVPGMGYRISMDVTNTDVDDLYLVVAERNGGINYEERAIITDGVQEFNYTATSNEAVVSIQKRGVTSVNTQTASISDFTVDEISGLDQVNIADNSGLSSWTYFNTTPSIVDGQLRVEGGLGDYMERTLTTVPGQAYRIAYGYSTPNRETYDNAITSIRFRVIDDNNTYIKHFQQTHGDREMIFVAQGTETKIRMQLWADNSPGFPSGSYAYFLLDYFNLYEMNTVGSPTDISDNPADWVTTGTASLSNDVTDNHLILTQGTKGDEASILLPVSSTGYYRVDMDYKTSDSGPGENYLTYTYTGSQWFRNTTSQATASAAFPTTTSDYFDIRALNGVNNLEIDFYSLTYTSIEQGASVLLEDYKGEPGFSAYGDWKTSDCVIEVENNTLKVAGEHGGYIYRDFPTTPGKVYKVVYDWDALSEAEGNAMSRIRIRQTKTNGGYIKHTQKEKGVNEFLFGATETTTRIWLQSWSATNYPSGSPFWFYLNSFSIVEMESNGIESNLSLNVNDWSINLGSPTFSNDIDGNLDITLVQSGDQLKQNFTVSPTGYYQLDVTYSTDKNTTSGLIAEGYSYFDGTTNAIETRTVAASSSLTFWATGGVNDLDVEVQEIKRSEIVEGTTIINEYYNLPDLKLLSGGTYDVNVETSTITATAAGDGISFELPAQANKDYQIVLDVTDKTTDITLEYISLPTGTVLSSQNITETGLVTLDVNSGNNNLVAINLKGQSAGTFDISSFSVTDLNPDQQTLADNSLGGLSDWKTQDASISIENDQLRVEVDDTAPVNYLYREFNLIPGKAYKASFKLTHNDVISTVKHVNYFTGTVLGDQSAAYSSQPTTNGDTKDLYFIAEEANTVLYFAVYQYYSGSTHPNIYYLDDFQLTMLDEVPNSSQAISLNVADWYLFSDPNNTASISNDVDNELLFGYTSISDVAATDISGLTAGIYRINAAANWDINRTILMREDWQQSIYYNDAEANMPYIFYHDGVGDATLKFDCRVDQTGTFELTDLDRTSLLEGVVLIDEDYTDENAPVTDGNAEYVVESDGKITIDAPALTDAVNLPIITSLYQDNTITIDLDATSAPANISVYSSTGNLLATANNVTAGTTANLSFVTGATSNFVTFTPVSSGGSPIIIGNIGSATSVSSQQSYYYAADVHSYTDYYPYGMPMPGRSKLDNDYRYGFNGMETDPEAKGAWGNQNTTFFRQYDARLGRWMSIDPVTHAFLSPYNAMDGNPMFWADPSGADGLGPGDEKKETKNGEAKPSGTGTKEDPIYTHGDITKQQFIFDEFVVIDKKPEEASASAPNIAPEIATGAVIEKAAEVSGATVAGGAGAAGGLTLIGVLLPKEIGPEPCYGCLDILMYDELFERRRSEVNAPRRFPKHVQELLDRRAYHPDPKHKGKDKMKKIVLYRGVYSNHPDWKNAKNGMAVPRALSNGHTNAWDHNDGDNFSVFTSWTLEKKVAEHFAGPLGIVLNKSFYLYELIPSPDNHSILKGDISEYEVLIFGVVRNARKEYVTRHTY